MNARFSLLLIASSCALGAAAQAADDAPFTDEFPLESCQFVPYGGNAFFRLDPGRRSWFSNAACVAEGECEDLEEVRISVLPQTRVIRLRDDGRTRSIVTRVVEEYETENGELKEISRNFFATCLPGRDVYYFGEEVFDGDGNPLPDAWLAGRKRAEPGIIMPGGAFLLGARYYQEIAPDVALDRAEHVALDLEIETPAGEFDDCVRVEESTPLSPGSFSDKVYCPGVGLVLDDEIELVRFQPAARRDNDKELDHGNP